MGKIGKKSLKKKKYLLLLGNLPKLKGLKKLINNTTNFPHWEEVFFLQTSQKTTMCMGKIGIECSSNKINSNFTHFIRYSFRVNSRKSDK
jgi:hypothetical protein